jgi:serine/threonine-protein kinase
MTTGRARELFLREARAVARLIHPNIVTAFDANQEGDRHYLVLEYVGGPNLDQLVRERGPLPVGQACDFVRQVALGLQHAHQLGMVHRDIKPANLLLQQGSPGNGGPEHVVKISDFGLARLNEAGQGDDALGTIATRENTVMGTQDYLSPEQARDLHRTDIRSDLYSLGCTFYYLLTGRVPFPGETTLEKLIRHGTEEPVPVERLRPGVPAAVVAVVRKLMAKRPEDRFQTPAELADALAPLAVAWKAPAVVAGQPSDDAAGAVTVTHDLSPTPVTGLGAASSARLSAAMGAQQRRRLKLAVFWACGLVGAGLLAALLAGVFIR